MSSRLPSLDGSAAAALCALFAIACSAPEDRPIGPGGSPDEPRRQADAAPSGNMAYGRICEVESFNDRGPCKPLQDSGLEVSTFSSFYEVDKDGNFAVQITQVAFEHVPVYVASTSEWLGGTLAADAEEGEDLYDLEVPVMRRQTADAIVDDSGATLSSGKGIIAMQVTNFSGLALDRVAFENFNGVDAMYGGPNSFQAGTMTTSTGTGAYFNVDTGSDYFELDFVDGGMDYTTHSIVAPDTFTIIPVQLSR